MKARFRSLLFATVVSVAPAAEGGASQPFIIVPLVVPEQELSGAMAALLASWQEEKVLGRIDQWQRLDELPAWAFDPKQREIAFIPPRPMVVHDYRFAVLVRKTGEVLLVRTGGLNGRYDYFQVLTQPNRPLPHSEGSRPVKDAAPAPVAPNPADPRG
jgi:hypothetical protein